MTIAITRELADTYFSSRIDAQAWEAFKTGLRDKAIQSATDIITRALGSAVTDETADTTNSYYPDRAVYHQAIFMLIHSDNTSNGELTAPKWPGVTKGRTPKEINVNKICPASLYWMNWRSGPTISLARG